MSSESFEVGFRSSLLNPLPVKKSTRVSLPMLNSLAAAINRGVAVSAINFFYVINYISLLALVASHSCTFYNSIQLFREWRVFSCEFKLIAHYSLFTTHHFIPFQIPPVILFLLHQLFLFPGQYVALILQRSGSIHFFQYHNLCVLIHRLPRFLSHH